MCLTCVLTFVYVVMCVRVCFSVAESAIICSKMSCACVCARARVCVCVPLDIHVWIFEVCDLQVEFRVPDRSLTSHRFVFVCLGGIDD